MSNFPQKIDILPTLVDNTSNTSVFTLSQIYSTIESIESHVGSAYHTSGDLRADGTEAAIGPNRVLSLQEATYTVPFDSSGLVGFLLSYTSLFSEKTLSESRPIITTELPSFSLQTTGNNSLPISIRTESPIIIGAYRRSTNDSISASILPSSSGISYISLTLITGAPFITGEKIYISVLFYGGA